MIAIYTYKSTRSPLVSCLLVILSILSILLYPSLAQATPARINLDAIDSYIQLVQRESMFDPPTTLLVQGAARGLREYLAQHGDRVSSPLKPTIDGFKQYFHTAAAHHPELSQSELFYSALHGMFKSLGEPYTRFLSPDEFTRLQARVEGTDECGLGVHLELDDSMVLTVVETFDKTPAARAGLSPGDRIVAIGGRSTAHVTLSGAKEALSGPNGAPVNITVRRGDRTFEMTVCRTRMVIPNVTWQMLGPFIGYVRLHAFSANAASELDQAMEHLAARGALSYVLDLRDNRGGYVSSAIDVCSRFLPPGTKIMSLQQKRQPTITYNAYRTPLRSNLLVLLVNERTASASEIVAGCLQDYNVATLMGTQTFGKGLVQKVIPLPDGSAFAISTGKYLTAHGRDLNKHGIMPDVVVRQTEFTTASLDPEVRQAAALLESRSGGQSAKIGTQGTVGWK